MAKAAPTDAARPAKPTIANTLAYIYRENGIKGLYRGVTPRIGLGIWQTVRRPRLSSSPRACPACARGRLFIHGIGDVCSRSFPSCRSAWSRSPTSCVPSLASSFRRLRTDLEHAHAGQGLAQRQEVSVVVVANPFSLPFLALAAPKRTFSLSLSLFPSLQQALSLVSLSLG